MRVAEITVDVYNAQKLFQKASLCLKDPKHWMALSENNE